MLIIVAAIGKQGQLGLNKVMAWHNPEDLHFYKNLTLHQKVVFGRVTYENLPTTLPDREVYLVSKNPIENDRVHHISDFKKFCQDHQESDEVYYICGGETIYRQALPYANEFYLSMIDYNGPADTYFPEFTIHEFDVEIINFETFELYHCKRKGQTR